MQQQQDLWDKGLATRENYVEAKNQLSDAHNKHTQTEQAVKTNELDEQSWDYDRQYRQEDYRGHIQILRKRLPICRMIMTGKRSSAVLLME